MKNLIKPMILQRSLFLLLAGVLLTGCFEESIITYDGPPVIEIAPYTPNGQYARTLVVPHDASGTVSYDVRVQLIAAHQSSPVGFTLGWEGSADPTGGNPDFTVEPGFSSEIPANSSWQDVTVTMQASAFQPGDSRSVTFTITEADVDIHAHNDTFTVTMAKGAVPPPDDD